MSRLMQIRVRVEAVYPKDLASEFPRLQHCLLPVDPSLTDSSPPLIELVPALVHLSQLDDLEPEVAQAIAEHGHKIVDLRSQALDAIGEWQLGKAENWLNRLEDAFTALEEALPELD